MPLTPSQINNPKSASQEEILMGIYTQLDEIRKVFEKIAMSISNIDGNLKTSSKSMYNLKR